MSKKEKILAQEVSDLLPEAGAKARGRGRGRGEDDDQSDERVAGATQLRRS